MKEQTKINADITEITHSSTSQVTFYPSYSSNVIENKFKCSKEDAYLNVSQ